MNYAIFASELIILIVHLSWRNFSSTKTFSAATTYMIYFLLVKRINYRKTDRRKSSSGIRFVERAHRACPMRACCCMLKDMHVCVVHHHACAAAICVSKLNKLSSRYSRIPTSGLEIRDFARTTARLFAMGNCAKRIANYAIARYFRRNFARPQRAVSTRSFSAVAREWKVECLRIRW